MTHTAQRRPGNRPGNRQQSAPATPAEQADQTEQAPETCKLPYERRVKGGAVKRYECGKPVGHDGPHGFGAPKAAAIKLSAVQSFEDIPTEETVEYGGGRASADRSEEQKLVDSHVKDRHERWIAAGKPEKFNDIVRAGAGGRYFMEPSEEAGFRSLLRSAATHHGLKVRIAGLQKHSSGKHMLPWVVVDVPPKAPATNDPNSQTNATDSATEPASAEEAGF